MRSLVLSLFLSSLFCAGQDNNPPTELPPFPPLPAKGQSSETEKPEEIPSPVQTETDKEGAGEKAPATPPQRIYIPSDPCLLYTSPSPRDQRGSRMPSSA